MTPREELAAFEEAIGDDLVDKLDRYGVTAVHQLPDDLRRLWVRREELVERAYPRQEPALITWADRMAMREEAVTC